MNTGLLPRPHPRKYSFVLSWSAGASETRKMKAQDTKRAFTRNFPATRPKAKFFEPRQIWYQNVPNLIKADFENNWLFWENIHAWREIALLVSLIVRKSLKFFCKQTRICIIPTRKVDPNIFPIALKQDYIDTQYVKLPYSMRPFSIFYVSLCKWRQIVQNLIILKESTLLDVMQIKFMTFC